MLLPLFFEESLSGPGAFSDAGRDASPKRQAVEKDIYGKRRKYDEE